MSWNVLYSPPPVTVAVVPLAGLLSLTGHPPTVVSGTSALALQLAGMSSGQWLNTNVNGSGLFPMGNLNTALISDGAGNQVLENGTKGGWDPVNKIATYCGAEHGGSYLALSLQYFDATNTWSNSSVSPPYPTGIAFDYHNFTLQAGTAATSDVWFARYGGGEISRLPSGQSTWTAITGDPQGSHAQKPGIAFSPTKGAQGTIYTGSFYGISAYDIATAAWTQVWAGTVNGAAPFPVSDQNSHGFYDVASGNVYFAGGSGSFPFPTSLVRVTPAGVLTQMGALPISCGTPQANAGQGIILDGYTTPGGVVRKPLLIYDGVGMWEYTSATDTWTSLGITPPANPDQADWAQFYIPISTYDGVLYVVVTSGTPTVSAYVYKR